MLLNFLTTGAICWPGPQSYFGPYAPGALQQLLQSGKLGISLCDKVKDNIKTCSKCRKYVLI